jgi:hypothetical protein
MSILTDRELEFLAGLNTSWSRLYWNELALLLTVQPGTAEPFLPLPLVGEVDALGSAGARRVGEISPRAPVSAERAPTLPREVREREHSGASCYSLIVT